MWDFLRLWFDSIWQLFQIEYPGFGLSIGAISLGALAAVIGLRVLGKILGFSFAPASILKGVNGGNNKNIRVPQNRKNDSH